MRRRFSATLFEKTPPKVYLFDTSAWLNIEALPGKEDIWSAIRGLVEQGRLFTCGSVIGELKDDPIYEARIKPLEKGLLADDPNSNNIAFLQHVGKITHDFPSMSKARGAKTPADSYVIARAQMEECIVVADENKRRKARKIPGVCEKLGICCKTLKEFILDEVGK